MSASQLVWLASYPKSGNTWFRAVYSAWLTGGPVDLGRLPGDLVAVRPVFDHALGVPSSALTHDEIDRLRPRADEVLAADADVPSLWKVHDAYLSGPGGDPIVSTAATRAALYFVRDPRDVAVSYAHRARRPSDWARERLRDPDAAIAAEHDRVDVQLRQRLGTWSEHVRSWVDDPPFPVTLVSYEDCVSAPVETFAKALEVVVGDPVERERVARAVAHAEFRLLREAEAAQGFDEPGAPPFFRRGEAGAWRDELPAAVAEGIAADHRDVMRRLGYL